MSKASSVERQMLDLINAERSKHGLASLVLDLRLNAAAEDHSRWLLEVDAFSHTGKGGSDPGDRMRDAGFEFSGSWTWTENVAWRTDQKGPDGLEDGVASLHRMLMDSPGHRANILNPDVEAIGIGVERGEYRGSDAVFATQNFARTSAALRVDEADGGRSDAAAASAPTPAVVEDRAIVGTHARDRLAGGSGDDLIEGREGDDVLRGNKGDDRLVGDDGGDRLVGGDGDDVLRGDGGNDVLKGNRGDDTIVGGDGDDLLQGGEGADRFVFDDDDGRDTLRFFADGLDEIVLDADGARPEVTVSQSGDDAIVRFGDTRIVVEDMVAGEIGHDDFHIV